MGLQMTWLNVFRSLTWKSI